MVPRHIFFVVCGLPLSKLSCDLFSKIQDFWQSASFGEIEVKQCTALAPYWVTHELALVDTVLRAKICVEIGKCGIEEVKRHYLRMVP
jgi:hypothetical protein